MTDDCRLQPGVFYLSGDGQAKQPLEMPLIRQRFRHVIRAAMVEAGFEGPLWKDGNLDRYYSPTEHPSAEWQSAMQRAWELAEIAVFPGR